MPQGGIVELLLPMVVLFVVMYFMIIRPQKKREKLTRDMLAGLIVGDKIVTIGGIQGKIVSIKDDSIVIATGTEAANIKVFKRAVKEVLKPADE